MREPLATLKGAYRFLKNDLLYGTVLYRYGLRRHRALQDQAQRSQHHTFTRFYRSPGQLEALTGPVHDWLRDREALRIHVFAASTGAEAYTVASVLARTHPTLDFHITASDLHPELVAHATRALYSSADVHRNAPPARFVADTFEQVGERYRVLPELRARVDVRQANLLDPDLADRFEPADIVFAQNVFCHLDREQTRAAFANVIGCLKSRSVLFVDGMDLDLREELTTQFALSPLDFKVREIHEHARSHVGDRWWNYYYGLEPYTRSHADPARRFATIFLRDTAI